MTTMSMEQILDRINDLKQESAEKDQVVRDQQMQIQDLENHIQELENQIEQLKEGAGKADELIEKLSQALGG